MNVSKYKEIIKLQNDIMKLLASIEADTDITTYEKISRFKELRTYLDARLSFFFEVLRQNKMRREEEG